MPFFKWVGTTHDNLCKGTLFARSYEHAVQKIQQQNIALIMMQSYKPLLYKRVSLQEKRMFIQQVSDLLQAGIRLYDALLIARNSIKNHYFLLHIDDCLQAVSQGVSLYQACSFYPHIFDPLAQALLQAGHETGNLARSTQQIVDYMTRQQTFNERMRSALLTPIITGIFFIAVTFFIFICIVPRFEILLLNSRAPLPLITRIVLGISHIIRSWGTLKMSMGFLIAGAGIYFLSSKSLLKNFFDAISLKIPFVGNLIYKKTVATFLMVTGILVKEKVPLLIALEQARQTVSQRKLYQAFEQISRSVSEGKSMSNALEEEPLLHDAALISLIQVGESTGTLDKLLLQGASMLQKNVEKSLESLTTFIQPLLLIVLGALIGMLIIAVYVPLLSLTSTLGTSF